RGCGSRRAPAGANGRPEPQARRFGEDRTSVKRGPWNAELLQGSANRQVGLLDQADDLGLFGCGVSHAASPPSPIMLFLSRRFSRVRSATTSFKAEASRRRSFTSSDVAARAVSPASRFLPASRKSFDQP